MLSNTHKVKFNEIETCLKKQKLNLDWLQKNIKPCVKKIRN